LKGEEEEENENEQEEKDRALKASRARWGQWPSMIWAMAKRGRQLSPRRL